MNTPGRWNADAVITLARLRDLSVDALAATILSMDDFDRFITLTNSKKARKMSLMRRSASRQQRWHAAALARVLNNAEGRR